LVYPIHDPTEVAIQKMIDTSQRMIAVQSQVGEEASSFNVVVSFQRVVNKKELNEGWKFYSKSFDK
jgi:hypothetical protein